MMTREQLATCWSLPAASAALQAATRTTDLRQYRHTLSNIWICDASDDFICWQRRRVPMSPTSISFPVVLLLLQECMSLQRLCAPHPAVLIPAEQ